MIGEKYDQIQRNYERDHSAPSVAEQFASWTHKLEFCDIDHAISIGDNIRIEAKEDDSDSVVHVLEGDVVKVDHHVVYVVGIDFIDIATTE